MSKPKAFVLMPFDDELADVYQYLIKDGLIDAGFSVFRADDIVSQNNILSDVIKGISSSDLIVADLTGSNPNVYYEVGIAHALDKSVILLTQSIEDLPFDIRSYRVVSYSVHFSKMNQAKQELVALASGARDGTVPFGNPIRDFRESGSFEKCDGAAEDSTLSTDGKDYGLLDVSVSLEDGFEELGEIVREVGAKLQTDVNYQVERCSEKLLSRGYSTKEKRAVVQELAARLQDYGAFIKPKNARYRALLNDLESSLERLLGSDIQRDDKTAEELKTFIDVLDSVAQSGSSGREGFSSLIDTMESLPNVERNFHRSKVFLVSELKDFVANIDQTVAVVSRATELGRKLLEQTA